MTNCLHSFFTAHLGRYITTAIKIVKACTKATQPTRKTLRRHAQQEPFIFYWKAHKGPYRLEGLRQALPYLIVRRQKNMKPPIPL